MKALPGLLAVLLMLSSTSLAQTATSPQTAPAQEPAPVQQAAPTQQATPGWEAAKAEAAKPEAESQASTTSPSPAASTPSADAAPASAGAVPAAALAPGAKLFLEPMGGFDQFMAEALVKKKVPVVVVKERADADFVVSGEAHVKKPGWFSGMVMDTRGKGNVSITDAHTGNQVFVHKFKKVDQQEAVGFTYQHWADQCAAHLKKTMEKK